MRGRKLEEGDWAHVYCAAKGIPDRGWSNLNIDIMHEGLGVEHKMLRAPEGDIRQVCGTRLMHPAATRSIRVSSTDRDANEVMRDVLTQYAKLIEERTRKVQADADGKATDMRVGWLLWQPSLRQFLYFEERMTPPNPDDYVAEWHQSGGGARKESKNLWVFDKNTGEKKFSITTAAGAKIQPYFEVPQPNDPNLYIFHVQGEQAGQMVRVWVSDQTERELQSILGRDLQPEVLKKAIVEAVQDLAPENAKDIVTPNEVTSLLLPQDAYQVLASAIYASSDEERMQLLVRRLRGLE